MWNPRRVWVRFYNSRTILPLTATVRVTPAGLPVAEYEPEDDPRPIADNPPRPPLDNRKPPPPRTTGEGYRSGLEDGHEGGRGYEQVTVQQALEARITMAEKRGEIEAAQVLHNLAAQLPDPRRYLRRVS